MSTTRIFPIYTFFWECTLRCNLECRHCGSDCLKRSESHDMPFADIEPVLRSIRAHQPETRCVVHTIGGEPLVRKDLPECGRKITEMGFLWGTVSNAMLLDGPMMRELSKSGLRSLAVDLDGLRPEHDWLRRQPGSFDKVFDAIAHIRRAPHLTWDVITCVNPRNIDSLPELKRLLTEAGVQQWRCFAIAPMGRAKDELGLQLSADQVRQLMEFIVETRHEGKINLSFSCEGYLGDYEKRVRSYGYNCQAGISCASVRENGDISGCLSIRSHYTQGNIYQDDFWDVWVNRFVPFRTFDWRRNGDCRDCDVFLKCKGGPMHLRDDEGNLMLCNYQRLFKQNI